MRPPFTLTTQEGELCSLSEITPGYDHQVISRSGLLVMGKRSLTCETFKPQFNARNLIVRVTIETVSGRMLFVEKSACKNRVQIGTKKQIIFYNQMCVSDPG